MNVTLPKELEEFVATQAASGAYPSPDAVVVEALRELQTHLTDTLASAASLPLENGNCPPELKALLLEAVRGPHHPMPADYFDKLRARIRSSSAT